MRSVRTHHVAIVTPDVARLRAFYTDTLGLPVVGGFADHAIVFVGAGGTTIELVEDEVPAGGTGRRGWHHLAWEVESVDATYAELSGRGVPFHVPPEDFPPAAPTMRIAFFTDPDGNAVELLQPLARARPGGRSARSALPGPANHRAVPLEERS